jgi:hypothetical protein
MISFEVHSTRRYRNPASAQPVPEIKATHVKVLDYS